MTESRKPIDRHAVGRTAARRGKAWHTACIRALRTETYLDETGRPAPFYPNAEKTWSYHRGDITGVGDVNLECKAEQGWNNLASHIAQARFDAERLDVPEYAVWRPAAGKVNQPMDGFIIMNPRNYFERRKEIERLEAVEIQFSEFLKRIRRNTP